MNQRCGSGRGTWSLRRTDLPHGGAAPFLDRAQMGFESNQASQSQQALERWMRDAAGGDARRARGSRFSPSWGGWIVRTAGTAVPPKPLRGPARVPKFVDLPHAERGCVAALVNRNRGRGPMSHAHRNGQQNSTRDVEAPKGRIRTW